MSDEIDSLCEKSWSILEEKLTVAPVLCILNRHDRGEELNEVEVDLIRSFIKWTHKNMNDKIYFERETLCKMVKRLDDKKRKAGGLEA